MCCFKRTSLAAVFLGWYLYVGSIIICCLCNKESIKTLKKGLYFGKYNLRLHKCKNQCPARQKPHISTIFKTPTHLAKRRGLKLQTNAVESFSRSLRWRKCLGWRGGGYVYKVRKLVFCRRSITCKLICTMGWGGGAMEVFRSSCCYNKLILMADKICTFHKIEAKRIYLVVNYITLLMQNNTLFHRKFCYFVKLFVILL